MPDAPTGGEPATAAAVRAYADAPKPPAPSRAVAALRGGWWAARELRVFRRAAPEEGFNAVVGAPPTPRRGALAGILAVLRARNATCLERSMIVQRWWAERGVSLDVLIGVRLPTSDPAEAEAHAWVEHWEADCSDRYAVIRRVPSPAAPARGSR